LRLISLLLLFELSEGGSCCWVLGVPPLKFQRHE
jgi:hypothetical protein